MLRAGPCLPALSALAFSCLVTMTKPRGTCVVNLSSTPLSVQNIRLRAPRSLLSGAIDNGRSKARGKDNAMGTRVLDMEGLSNNLLAFVGVIIGSVILTPLLKEAAVSGSLWFPARISDFLRVSAVFVRSCEKKF